MKNNNSFKIFFDKRIIKYKTKVMANKENPKLDPIGSVIPSCAIPPLKNNKNKLFHLL